MKTWRRHFLFLIPALVLFGTSIALAEPKTFTLVQSNSSLFITGDVAGAPFTPQASGSLTTSYTGTIEVNLTLPTITFTGNSSIVASNNGSWQPLPGGGSGSAPGNYGGNVNGGLFTAVAAVRNTLLDVTNSGSTVVSGGFPATDLTFYFPANAITAIDYRYTVIFSQPVGGTTPLSGGFPNANTNNATLVIQGSEYVLTIPVDISGVEPTTVGDINYRLRGKFVAKAPAPPIPVPLRIKDFSLSGNQATIKIDTTPSQHFTILGSTNFTTWTTNDQFTSSTTNTTRVVTLPAPFLSQRFFRVRQD
jgi:hypothetical protein